MNSRIRWTLINVLLALVYAGSSYITIRYMMRTTLPSALWPATGIAIAAVILYGRKIIPGIIGGELINAVLLYGILEDFGLNLGTLYDGMLLIAAILRPLIALYLIELFFLRPFKLIQLSEIIKFFLAVAILPCFFSSIFISSILFTEGIYTEADVVLRSIRRYFGDLISIMIFVPVIMSFFAKPRNIWRPRIKSVFIPVAFGFFFMLALFNSLNLHEENRIRQFTTVIAQQIEFEFQSKYDHIEGFAELMAEPNKTSLKNEFSITVSGNDPAQSYYSHDDEASERMEVLAVFKEFSKNGFDYRLKVVPTEHYLNTQFSWALWWLVFIGLSFTGLFGGGLLAITGRNALTALEVDKRTKQLDSANRELIISNENYQNLIDTQPVIFWKVNIVKDKITFVSREAESILGYPVSQWLEEKDFMLDRIHVDDRERIKKTMLEIHKSGESRKLEYRMKHANGQYRWFTDELNMHRALTHDDECMGMLIDITDKKNAERRIRKLAFFDYLTKLPNRQNFHIKLKKMMKEAKRDKSYGAILFLDMDRFKVLNDSLGHHYGDILLVKMAKRLDRFKDEFASIARFGGDEFVIATQNNFIREEDASIHVVKLANQIIQTLAKPYNIGSHKHSCTVSIGLAIFPNEQSTTDDIIKHADAAMYRSKNKGRNQVTVYHESMKHDDDHLLYLEQVLRTAVSDESFDLKYQPIVNQYKEIICYEALVRLVEDNATIYPSDFIPVAEETGMIHPLGKWVINESFKKVKSMGRAISINVSSKQFHQDGFVVFIEKAIKQYGIQPREVMIELTEGVMVGDFDEILDKFKRLKKMGILIAIDDFGAGYSSLQYLRQLPVDFLKIDKSFVGDLGKARAAEEIVKAIISMAQNLKYRTVAEGVETERQYEILKKYGCDFFQGYLFGEPGNIKKNEIKSLS